MLVVFIRKDPFKIASADLHAIPQTVHFQTSCLIFHLRKAMQFRHESVIYLH